SDSGVVRSDTDTTHDPTGCRPPPVTLPRRKSRRRPDTRRRGCGRGPWVGRVCTSTAGLGQAAPDLETGPLRWDQQVQVGGNPLVALLLLTLLLGLACGLLLLTLTLLTLRLRLLHLPTPAALVEVGVFAVLDPHGLAVSLPRQPRPTNLDCPAILAAARRGPVVGGGGGDSGRLLPAGRHRLQHPLDLADQCGHFIGRQ